VTHTCTGRNTCVRQNVYAWYYRHTEKTPAGDYEWPLSVDGLNRTTDRTAEHGLRNIYRNKTAVDDDRVDSKTIISHSFRPLHRCRIDSTFTTGRAGNNRLTSTTAIGKRGVLSNKPTTTHDYTIVIYIYILIHNTVFFAQGNTQRVMRHGGATDTKTTDTLR